MPSIQQRQGAYRVLFCYGRKLHSLPLGKVSESEAEYRKTRTEELLKLVEKGLLEIPAGVTVVDFMHHDGKPPVEPEFQVRKETTLHQLREEYIATMSNGAIEATTLYTVKIHLTHIEQTLGKNFLLSCLTLRRLQAHVDRRSADVTPTTIKKEIDGFRCAWNWGVRANLIRGGFPSAGLVYAKTAEKLPFMGWKEIERRVKAGGDADLLWECLYLDASQVTKMLADVKAKKAPAWVYPMLATAAHTGMRRSELIRARVEDIDLANGVITVREKKRAKGMVSSRRVPVSKRLAAILKEYLATRHDSTYVFGYGGETLSVQTTQKAFVRVLKDSKWAVVKGWHTLRHSWVSIMASSGADQRLIDDCVGHSTEQQRRRYRHLFPQVKAKAIELAFG
jgi:integrase